MRWSSILAIYLLFWSFTVFLVIPFGIRTHEESSADRIPGQADSAPYGYDFRKMVFRTTLVSAVIFALYYVNYVNGWITPDDVDLISRFAR